MHFKLVVVVVVVVRTTTTRLRQLLHVRRANPKCFSRQVTSRVWSAVAEGETATTATGKAPKAKAPKAPPKAPEAPRVQGTKDYSRSSPLDENVFGQARGLLRSGPNIQFQ